MNKITEINLWPFYISTSMHSSRMRTLVDRIGGGGVLLPGGLHLAGLHERGSASSRWEWGLHRGGGGGGWADIPLSLSTEWQTGVKTLPCPKFHLRAVIKVQGILDILCQYFIRIRTLIVLILHVLLLIFSFWKTVRLASLRMSEWSSF